MSERLDVSRQTVSRWETGNSRPSTEENLQALCKLYTLLRLSRAITNAFYTNAEKYDQDSYGRTILSKPLPLLFPTIKLSRLDKDTLEYRLLYTQMLRNRNRVADAVLTACEYAELFLAQK